MHAKKGTKYHFNLTIANRKTTWRQFILFISISVSPMHMFVEMQTKFHLNFSHFLINLLSALLCAPATAKKNSPPNRRHTQVSGPLCKRLFKYRWTIFPHSKSRTRARSPLPLESSNTPPPSSGVCSSDVDAHIASTSWCKVWSALVNRSEKSSNPFGGLVFHQTNRPLVAGFFLGACFVAI